MTFIKEIKIFFGNILDWLYTFIFFCFFFFSIGIEKVLIRGNEYVLLVPSDNSISIQVFNKIRQDLISPDVQLVVTNPMSAFVSQISLTIVLSFLFTAPFFIYKIFLYLNPALHPHEKKVIAWLLWPVIFLFILGALFSYYLLIPATFKVLYPYATSIGATALFSLDEFTYYVISLMVAVGLMFLLPLFMILLSFVGAVDPEFWRSKWKYALLLFLIFSAIITPDGTGITMAMLFIPLCLLYFFGYIFSKKLSRHKVINKKGRSLS